ncbi:MAG TPA: hypothetical protein VF121_10515 [Thermoanaerobaculia bacterium]|nr:hypothetical protein [Thermoanaerobaculia bacterium]
MWRLLLVAQARRPGPLHLAARDGGEKEERVEDHLPELRPPRAVSPQLLRTGDERVLEHLDRGAELLPEDGSAKYRPRPEDYWFLN